jgi:hypothetical protein
MACFLPTQTGFSILRITFWGEAKLMVRGKASMERDPSIQSEMRKEIRYRLGTLAVFSWEGANRRRLKGEGMTRDISIQGAYILTATNPPADCIVRLDLMLPPLTGPKTAMRITGEARVIRVEHRPGNNGTDGFAVVTDDLNQWGLKAAQSEPEMALGGVEFEPLKVVTN